MLGAQSSIVAPNGPVYSKVEDVVVPDGTRPGEKFTVNFWKVEKGAASRRKKRGLSCGGRGTTDL